MGSCYSHQGLLAGKDTIPLNSQKDNNTDKMPHPTDHNTSGPPPTDTKLTSSPRHQNSRFGFKKSHGGRYQNGKPGKNSNEQSLRDSERSALGLLSNGDSEVPVNGKRSKEGFRGGFGMKGMGYNKDRRQRGDRTSNEATGSSESVNSQGGVRGGKGGSASLPSSKQSSLKRAYIPRSNTGSWKMIDDASSSYSGKSGEKLDRTSRSHTPVCNNEDINNGNDSTKSTPVKSIPAHVLQAPIAAVESLETLCGTNSEDTNDTTKTQATKSIPTGRFQSRLRGPFTKSHTTAGTNVRNSGQSDHQVQSKPTNDKSDKLAKNTPPQHTQVKGKQNGGGFLRKGFFRKQKTLPEDLAISSQKENKPLLDKEENEKNVVEINNDEVFVVGSLDKPKEPTRVEKEEIITDKKQSPAEAAIPILDALETTSIGSIHSDDLMLDLDMDEYEELAQTNVASAAETSQRYSGSRPRSRSGSRSRSRDNVTRRSSGALPTASQSQESRRGDKKADSSGQKKLHERTPTEPLQELATLVEARSGGSASQRRQRQRAARPASFPGPRFQGNSPTEEGAGLSGSHGGSLILKPPRHGSVHVDEDDLISIDGFTYRHLVQDVTTFKTMLLKLKRLIQEDEFHGQNWKNGFKLSGSQPTSPYDDTKKFSFSGSLEAEEGLTNPASVDEVIKENLDLKQQVQGMKHQMEEQERTIKLLQQQMTKYECGYSEPGGKAYSHVATQTDKPSGFYKNTGMYKTASVRRTPSNTSQPPTNRYRTEFRKSLRSNSSQTANDEVFLGLDSCDIDDEDVGDFLMEDVSLGDSFSLADSLSNGTSFHGSSAASPATPGDSLFSKVNREHPLSEHLFPEKEQSFTHSDSREQTDTPKNVNTSHNPDLLQDISSVLSPKADSDTSPDIRACNSDSGFAQISLSDHTDVSLGIDTQRSAYTPGSSRESSPKKGETPTRDVSTPISPTCSSPRTPKRELSASFSRSLSSSSPTPKVIHTASPAHTPSPEPVLGTQLFSSPNHSRCQSLHYDSDKSSVGHYDSVDRYDSGSKSSKHSYGNSPKNVSFEVSQSEQYASENVELAKRKSPVQSNEQQRMKFRKLFDTEGPVEQQSRSLDERTKSPEHNIVTSRSVEESSTYPLSPSQTFIDNRLLHDQNSNRTDELEEEKTISPHDEANNNIRNSSLSVEPIELAEDNNMNSPQRGILTKQKNNVTESDSNNPPVDISNNLNLNLQSDEQRKSLIKGYSVPLIASSTGPSLDEKKPPVKRPPPPSRLPPPRPSLKAPGKGIPTLRQCISEDSQIKSQLKPPRPASFKMSLKPNAPSIPSSTKLSSSTGPKPDTQRQFSQESTTSTQSDLSGSESLIKLPSQESIPETKTESPKTESYTKSKDLETISSTEAIEPPKSPGDVPGRKRRQLPSLASVTQADAGLRPRSAGPSTSIPLSSRLPRAPSAGNPASLKPGAPSQLPTSGNTKSKGKRSFFKPRS